MKNMGKNQTYLEVVSNLYIFKLFNLYKKKKKKKKKRNEFKDVYKNNLLTLNLFFIFLTFFFSSIFSLYFLSLAFSFKFTKNQT